MTLVPAESTSSTPRQTAAQLASELEGIAERHQELRLHLVNSTVDGRLTADEVLATAGDDPTALSVFLCGPEGMVRTFKPTSTGLACPGKRSTASTSSGGEPPVVGLDTSRFVHQRRGSARSLKHQHV